MTDLLGDCLLVCVYPKEQADEGMAEGVKGYYPSFDITPPELVTGVATPEGIFSPYELDKYVKATDGKYRVVV